MSVEPATSDCRRRLTDWVHQHGLAVRGYLRSLLGRQDLADELSQEVFQRAWVARDRYVDRGQARAYLLTIADRLACDALRRRSPESVDDEVWQALEPAADTVDPLETLAMMETGMVLQSALDRLSASQRRVLLLRFYGDLSFQQIAESMGCPLNTVLSHCRRGLLALKRLLVEAAL
jgi:RNA polymerase sigma-70 factor (ECF subfamily)